MKVDKEGIVYVVVFSFVVCAAFVAGLAFANEATKPAVAANREFAANYAKQAIKLDGSLAETAKRLMPDLPWGGPP